MSGPGELSVWSLITTSPPFSAIRRRRVGTARARPGEARPTAGRMTTVPIVDGELEPENRLDQD